MDQMLKKKEIAKRLSVTNRTVERLIAKGELRAYKVDVTKKRSPVLIRQSDVEKYLERNRVA